MNIKSFKDKNFLFVKFRLILLSSILGGIYSILFIGSEITEILFFVLLGLGVVLSHNLSEILEKDKNTYFKFIVKRLFLGYVIGFIIGVLSCGLISFAPLEGALLGGTGNVLFLIPLNTLLFFSKNIPKKLFYILFVLILLVAFYILSYIVSLFLF